MSKTSFKVLCKSRKVLLPRCTVLKNVYDQILIIYLMPRGLARTQA